MRWKGLVLSLAVLGLMAGWVQAGDVEEQVERILKKYDEKYRALREEMRRELLEAMGKGAPAPAPGAGAPFLGVDVEAVPEGLRVLLNLEKEEGLVISKVVEGGPADKAGIRRWDILLVYGGKKVGSKDGLRDAVGGTRPGQRIGVLVLRDGEKVELQLLVGSREGGEATPVPGVGEYLDEALRSRLAKVRENLKRLVEGGVQERMRARRFFEDLLNKAGKDRDKIFGEIEKAAEDFLGKLSPADREEMRRVFKDMMGGFRRTVERKGSQDKEAIERFLEDMLGGKKPVKKDEPKKDDIDKLLDELLGKGGKKNGKEEGAKEPKKPAEDEELPVKIPPEWDKALEDILGKDGWARIKEMMLSPQYKEMIRQMFPEGFEFTPANVRKLLETYGIDMESLPDRLREMGVEEDAIERVLELLESDEAAPPKTDKKVKGWLGIRGRNTLEDQGVEISRLEDGGPAGPAGFKEGDVIVKAGRFKITNLDDLKKALEGKFAGDGITFTVVRDGNELKIKLTLIEKK